MSSLGTPRSDVITYVCDCGHEYRATVHHAVNITLEPQLLYELLAGRLNVAVCPNCGRRVSSELPFIYHDMKRGLFAYVHPSGDLPEDERDELLEQLRLVYTSAVRQSEHLSPPHPSGPARHAASSRPRDAAEPRPGVTEPDAPPMQVIFGVDQLVALVDSLLEPEERLGHVALNTRNQDPAARERFLQVARRMAQELNCLIEVAERGGALTVEIYGPRSRIGQLVTILHTLT
ncbi:MAG TPA: CpXC domain-containing protein [Ktedonobacterales bacterium]